MDCGRRDESCAEQPTPFRGVAANQLIGKRIEAIGVAQSDQKDDAFITCDGVRLRISGASRLADELEGARIRVVGTLGQIPPPATSDSRGAIDFRAFSP